MHLPKVFEIVKPYPIIFVTLPNGVRHSGKVISSLNGIIHYRSYADKKEYFVNITAINYINFSYDDDEHTVREITSPMSGYILHQTLEGYYIHSKTTTHPYVNYDTTFGKVSED